MSEDSDILGSFVKEFISYVLVRVSDEIEKKIEEKFKVLAITCQDDLNYVEDQDFIDILTPIQIRKVQHWKEKLSRADSVSSSSSINSSILLAPPPSSVSTPTSSDNSVTEFNKNAEWAETVPIPFSKIIPKVILNELDKDNISNENRRVFVRNIVEEVRKHSQNVSSNQYRIISRRIVNKYKCLKDNMCGQVIGSGYDGLANQLVHRNDNCNRGKTPFGRKKRNSEDSEKNSKILTKKDAYGCVQFSPCLIDTEIQESVRTEMTEMTSNSDLPVLDWDYMENQLKITYPLQRREINSQEFITSELLKRWPLLFRQEGISLHFKLLTGIEVVEAFDNFLADKGERLVMFFGEERSANVSKITRIVTGTLSKMKEKKEDLLTFTDPNSTAREVERMINGGTPKIVVLGPTIDDATEFMIVVDGVKVTTCNSFKIAFICYLSVYYVLNIKYPENLESTLEFFQRIVLGINPQSGTKAKKRKNSVNVRVLKFITEISQFEWTVPATI